MAKRSKTLLRKELTALIDIHKEKKKRVPNKKVEPPIILNLEGLKKKMKEYIGTLDSSKDSWYDSEQNITESALLGFLNYIYPNHDGTLKIYSIVMDGNSSAVVIAYGEEHAKDILLENRMYNTLVKISFLGDANKGQNEGVVTL